MKQLLLGDEAIALGAIHAGISGVYAYPGTPSTEITEYIQRSPLARERNLHSRWCTNEKTAMEAALGMSFMGKRALVCMKHVGMNVCADPFVNSGMTGVNGGVVVLAADDPSMHSSQDEQDSRFYGKFAMVPIFEPSSQQEAYDMMEAAFTYSEQQNLPVLATLTTLGTLIGLFGTVLGMIKSFQALSASGAPDSTELSTGISEALVNTALGIATAALALIGYNFYTNKIDNMTYAIDELGFSIVSTFSATH